MKINSLKLLSIILLSGLSMASCKKASNIPVDKTVTIFQPCNGVKTVSGPWKDVNFRQKIFVKVQNSIGGVSNFTGTPIYQSRSCSGSGGDTYIPYGKEYTVPEPSSGYYGIQVFVETQECGWPISTYGNPPGGKAEYEANSTVVPQPQNVNLFPTDFIVIYTEQC